MRSLVLPGALLGLLVVPSAAFAGPTLYVCTVDARVLTVDGTTGGAPSVLFTGTGSFHDCKLGPDKRLYIANDNNILWVNTDNPAESGFVNAAPLNFTPRSLAFNVTTMFITSIGNGPNSKVYQWTGVPASDGTNTAGPLSFPGSPVNAFNVGNPGRGLAFDNVGFLYVASDSRVDRAAPPYSSASTVASGGTPVGVAVNTCNEGVYADADTNAIRRVGSTTPIATFSEKPLYIEVDSENVMYAVSSSKLDGSAAKIWRVPFAFATTGCGTATPSLLVDLKDYFSGHATDAVGIAVSATNKTLTNTTAFSATHCSDEYNFGYHRVTLEFTDCANSFLNGATANVTVEAMKSTLSETTFTASAFANMPTPIEGMRYSPMGGFIVQYKINAAGSPGLDLALAPVRLIYHFDTQEFVVAPGVAKRDGDDSVTAEFNQNTGNDYWEAGKLDPPAGERTDGCCSKHVVYNAGAVATPSQCFWTYDEPLKSQNPLFNGSQTINVSGLAKNGNYKCDGGVLRISIFRAHFPQGQAPSCSNLDNADSAVFLDVMSAGGAQTDNIMSVTGQGKYKFNLDSSGYETGVHVLTIFGPIFTAPGTLGSLNIPSAVKCFQYNKAQ